MKKLTAIISEHFIRQKLNEKKKVTLSKQSLASHPALEKN